MIARADRSTPPRVLAIDPGSAQSGVVVYDPMFPRSPVCCAGVIDNDMILGCLHDKAIPAKCFSLVNDPPPCAELVPIYGPFVLAVEFPVAQGMPASNELFVTVEWIGRFREAWGGEFVHVARPAVKLHLCGVARAKDGNVRAALIDRFGGESALSKRRKCATCKGTGQFGQGRGSKRTTHNCHACGKSGYLGEDGPLYGVSSHAWPALAVAVTYIETTAHAEGGRDE